MKHGKKVIAVMLILIMTLSLAACGGGDETADGKTKLTIAHQYGIAYAPLEVMKQQKLIEKHYDGVEVEWSTLNSGSAINEGFLSGDIDAVSYTHLTLPTIRLV